MVKRYKSSRWLILCLPTALIFSLMMFLLNQVVCLKLAVWAVAMKQPITKVPSVLLWRVKGKHFMCFVFGELHRFFLNNMKMCFRRYRSFSFEHKMPEKTGWLSLSDVRQLNNTWWHCERKLWLKWNVSLKATLLLIWHLKLMFLIADKWTAIKFHLGCQNKLRKSGAYGLCYQ